MIGWSGVARDRVVAVVARVAGDRVQVGSGYLVSRTTVLTAAHCTVDKTDPDRPVSALRVFAPGGFSVTIPPADVLRDPDLDVAVIRVTRPPWSATDDWTGPRWARIDRTASGLVPGCEAIGYPMWQQDPADANRRGLAELSGAVRRLEDSTSRLRHLVLRDPELTDVAPPHSARQLDQMRSPWGGLSGALVFSRGWAIGVVVEHHPRQGKAAVRVLPVDRIAEADSPAARAVVRELGLPSLDRFPWAFPDDFDAVARMSAAAAEAAGPSIRGRSGELASLAELGGPGPSRRRWVRGARLAGKTTLLATVATNPPPRTTVVSCLLDKRKGRNSARFVLDSLTKQLVAVAWRQGYLPSTDEWDLVDDFRGLLAPAAAACTGRGDQLLMILDGLDEYDPDAVVELGEWLPVELPPGMSLLVASRPDLREIVVDWRHDAVLDLDAYEGADADADRTRTELLVGRGSDPLLRSALDRLAVVGGGLTTGELTDLLGADAALLDRLLETRLRRTLVREAAAEPADSPWAFTHDVYSAAALDLIRAPDADRARQEIDVWADRYRRDGWPSATPRFLLAGYVPHLRVRVVEAASPDDRRAAVERLCAVVTSPGRWTAMMLRHRTPLAPETEIIESQNAVRSACADGGLMRLEDELRMQVQLALTRRGGDRGLVTRISPAVAGTWTLAGDHAAAADFAASVKEPDGRVDALGEVAVALAVLDSGADVDVAVERVLAAVPVAGVYANSRRVRVALRLARVGRFDAAEKVAESVDDSGRRVGCLAQIGLAAARSPRHADSARRLARTVADAASRIGFAEPYRPLGVAAEILARLGDHTAAEQLLHLARARTATEHGKYRHWAEIVVQTMRWRCVAVRVAGRSDASEITDDPELTQWFGEDLDVHLNRLEDFVHAVHVAALLAEFGHRHHADVLAATAIDRRLTGTDRRQEAGYIGAAAPEIASVLLDGGLCGPVLLFADLPIAPHRSVFGGNWDGEVRDVVNDRLARTLAAVGRTGEAAARLQQIGSDELRMHTEAGIAYDTLLDDASRTDDAVRRTRQLIDDLLAQAVEQDFDHRRSALLRRIDGRSAPAVAVVGDARSMADLLVLAHQRSGRLATAELLREQEPDDVRRFNDSAEEAGGLAHVVGELAGLDHVEAAPWALDLDRRVRPILVAAGERGHPLFDVYPAAETAVTALCGIGEIATARSLAETMLATLSSVPDPVADSTCIADSLGRTARALAVSGGLTTSTVGALRDVAWSIQASPFWEADATRMATAFAAVGDPGLARIAVELVLADRSTAPHNAYEWYRPALAVLAALVRDQHDDLAARVGQALFRTASDPDTLWLARAEVLGGLVRVGETTTRDEALRRLVLSAGFYDYAHNLPIEMLRGIREQLVR